MVEAGDVNINGGGGDHGGARSINGNSGSLAVDSCGSLLHECTKTEQTLSAMSSQRYTRQLPTHCPAMNVGGASPSAGKSTNDATPSDSISFATTVYSRDAGSRSHRNGTARRR